MKVLILNGSPKLEKSNTLNVTNAFVSGFPEGTEVKKIDIYSKDIKPCRGCFACWASKDGTCAIKDDMPEIIAAIKEADIIIAAIGKPDFVTADMVKEGAVIVDVGTTRVPDASRKSGFRLNGDVKFDEVSPKCSFITPVPGGVGPMTICSLMKNTLAAGKKEFYK